MLRFIVEKRAADLKKLCARNVLNELRQTACAEKNANA
jgi:hypothetical protein